MKMEILKKIVLICANISVSIKEERKEIDMGRGNICVRGEYEGLYYVDRDYLDCYTSKDVDEDGEHEYKMLEDMNYEDFESFDWDYDLSYIYMTDFINTFIERMKKKFDSFSNTGEDFGTIMENSLFEIVIKDNEWSYAVELIQKDDFNLEGLQKKHYQNYLDGMKDILLGMFPTIGVYSGAWTHGVISR